MAIDPRFLASSGREIFTGNELLIKGALEVDGGVHLLTGYPGSPIAGFFDILGDIAPILTKNGIRAYQANNEALASAAANGSQMLPCRTIVAMKNVGLHVAADALALATLAGAHPEGGAIVICGEDPWCDSTQVPADSRFLCEHLRMVVVEPGTIQEVKDWIDLSLKLSKSAGLYVGFIVTTAQADGGGTVDCKPNQFPKLNMLNKVTLETQAIPVQRTVLLPPRTWQKELGVRDRFEITMQAARELGVNKIYPATAKLAGADAVEAIAPVGFITTGMARPYLRHVLSDVGLLDAFPILNLGLSYPADVKLVKEFARSCKRMIVIEERRSFLEKNIRDSLFREFNHEEANALSGKLYGKAFPARADGTPLAGIPDTRGLSPSELARIIIPLLQETTEIPLEARNGRLAEVMGLIREASRPNLKVISDLIVPRTPTFCPGCPHRDSSAALLEIRKNLADEKYMQDVHGMKPVDLVAHGDTGCYTMLMFAPTEQLMHNYSGMGLGSGTGSGIDPFITNKQIVFMGDGTFFHSGQIGISNAIKAGQDITFIILKNDTTAMTGHQEHAGTDHDVLGNDSYRQDIEAVVRGMASLVDMPIVRLSPADRGKYQTLLEGTILKPGVKVIIADKECGITYHRKELKAERKVIKEKGYLPEKTHMNITPEVCEHCLECTLATACPGLTTLETDYGRKIDTDLTWCVNDGACVRVTTSNSFGKQVKPCPSFEEVKIVRSKRRRYTLPHMGLDKLPDPQVVHAMDKPGDMWRVHMSGVGGMGIGVVGAILVRAGHKQGYSVLFQDKKGLAIRNGGVFGQMTFINDGQADQAPEARATVTAVSAGSRTEREDKNASAVHGLSGNSLYATADSTTGSADASAAVHKHRPPAPRANYATTGAIPYGRANLLLGIDILEAARATDPREYFRIAHKDRTAAVLNLHKQPTVYTLLGKSDVDPEELRDEILKHCDAGHSYAKNLSELCEQRLGSKQFVNIMMLGVAFQLGLIPVSAHAIAWAIKDSIRRDHRKNLKAFNIGRKLALEPNSLPRRPQPQTWDQLATNKVRILRKTKLFGRKHAEAYERLVESAMKLMRHLGDQSKYDLAVRLYDLMQYQDARLAKKYLDAVRSVYKKDLAANAYAATHAVIWNLAKVMLIKDEPYVAYLLTRYEKTQRDLEKYGVDLSNGDKILYRHFTSPEFNIGKRRIRLKITTRDWQLKLVSRMKWCRKLPQWHARDVQFRDWYRALLERISLSDPAAYEQALAALKCPESVTGYREVRYPKMDRAMAEIETLLQPAQVREPVGVA